MIVKPPSEKHRGNTASPTDTAVADGGSTYRHTWQKSCSHRHNFGLMVGALTDTHGRGVVPTDTAAADGGSTYRHTRQRSCSHRHNFGPMVAALTHDRGAVSAGQDLLLPEPGWALSVCQAQGLASMKPTTHADGLSRGLVNHFIYICCVSNTPLSWPQSSPLGGYMGKCDLLPRGTHR